MLLNKVYCNTFNGLVQHDMQQLHGIHVRWREHGETLLSRELVDFVLFLEYFHLLQCHHCVIIGVHEVKTPIIYTSNTMVPYLKWTNYPIFDLDYQLGFEHNNIISHELEDN